jgi:hypothetical protein
VGVAKSKFIALSEAQEFLKEAKALQMNSQTFERISRYSRASILLSWVALEAVVAYELKKTGYKHKRGDNLAKVLEILATQRQLPFDKKAYGEQRRIRNAVTHPTNTFVWTCPDSETAGRVFHYCISLINQLYSIPDPWY